jgi:hypothetical protein
LTLMYLLNLIYLRLTVASHLLQKVIIIYKLRKFLSEVVSLTLELKISHLLIKLRLHFMVVEMNQQLQLKTKELKLEVRSLLILVPLICMVRKDHSR